MNQPSITTESNVLTMTKLSELDSTYTEPANITSAIKAILSFLPTDYNPDNVLFLTSVLRTQLELSVLLKLNTESSVNPNIKRSCFSKF